MRVVEHLAQATEPLISFEIIPPKRGGNLRDLLNLVDALSKHRPPFIDITSHPAEVVYEETEEGIQRTIKRKRPGTLGLCALIQNKYEIDAVPHVLCNGFTQQETEDFLIELRYLGIENVLAVRGDDKGYHKPLTGGRTRNEYAVDLVRQIVSMNEGNYLDAYLDASPTDFCVGVSGYPEKHFEAPNRGSDLRYAKMKVDAGAEYIVTQMFFDNQVYFDFVDRCREAGINVPIIPGLKVLTSKRHLNTIPRTFHCDLPEELASAIEGAKKRKDAIAAGAEWTAMQAQELLDRGVPSVHFYVMGNAGPVDKVLAKLKR